MAFRAGDVLFEVTLQGKERGHLVEFSAGTEDPNPIHLDNQFAKAAGFPALLQQGPMTTAHFARLLADHVGQQKLKWLDVTFTAPVFVGEEMRLRAEVTGVENGLVACALTAEKADGTSTAKAQAAFEA